MKRLIAFAFATSILIASVHAAATVNFSAQDFNGFTDASGNALADGDVVEVGYFNATDQVLQSDAGNFSALNSLFTLFGTGHIGDNVSGLAGYFGDSASPSQGTEGLGLVGKQIYFWVFNGSNPSTATQEGIFYLGDTSGSSFASSWQFKDDNAVPNTSNPDIANLTNGGNSLAAGADVVIGRFGPGTISSAFPNATAFELAPTPEPATAGLAIVGGMAMLLRRRRV